MLFSLKTFSPTGLNPNVGVGISTSYDYSTEVIDLSKKGNNECENWGDFPWDTFTMGQTGGLLGKIPIIFNVNRKVFEALFLN